MTLVYIANMNIHIHIWCRSRTDRRRVRETCPSCKGKRKAFASALRLSIVGARAILLASGDQIPMNAEASARLKARVRALAQEQNENAAALGPLVGEGEVAGGSPARRCAVKIWGAERNLRMSLRLLPKFAEEDGASGSFVKALQVSESAFVVAHPVEHKRAPLVVAH